MKVFVFGANGMIGRYIHSYLKRSIPVTRDMVDALHIRNSLLLDNIDRLNITDGDVVINAIGITNKHTSNIEDFFIVNSLFPRLLADYCVNKGVKMIHISTDCVFSGETGAYSEKDRHDDESVYGISKSAGEPSNCTVIRTSIIAENPNNDLDLLEWVRSKKGGVIGGFKRHFWNGITGLQFAKLCKNIINTNAFYLGVTHVSSPRAVSKFDLVSIINDVYDLGINIKPYAETSKFNEEPACDRTLTSLYKRWGEIPDIETQLIEQRDYKWE